MVARELQARFHIVWESERGAGEFRLLFGPPCQDDEPLFDDGRYGDELGRDYKHGDPSCTIADNPKRD